MLQTIVTVITLVGAIVSAIATLQGLLRYRRLTRKHEFYRQAAGGETNNTRKGILLALEQDLMSRLVVGTFV